MNYIEKEPSAGISIDNGTIVLNTKGYSKQNHHENVEYQIKDNELVIFADRVRYELYATGFYNRFNLDDIAPEDIITVKPWIGKPYQMPKEGWYRLKKTSRVEYRTNKYILIR